MIEYRGAKGIVVNKIGELSKEAQQSLNFYGLRHSDENLSLRTIEEKIVRVNSFGVFVTPDKIRFENDGYFDLSKEERSMFASARRAILKESDIEAFESHCPQCEQEGHLNENGLCSNCQRMNDEYDMENQL